VGIDDGCMVGSAVGPRVGFDDGKDVGYAVGSAVGWMLGCAVGSKVGIGVGGLVYSTTIVEVATDELAVAFLLAVIFTAVMFALAASNAFDRLPLAAAERMSKENNFVRFRALPSNPSSVLSRRPSSFERATTPCNFISILKRTSISVTIPAAFVTFSARIEEISEESLKNEIMLISVLLMAL
jgi:hypothetical protein